VQYMTDFTAPETKEYHDEVARFFDLHPGQGQALTSEALIGWLLLRVKVGSWLAWTACPFYPQQQTSSDRSGTSGSCQKATSLA
jgi:hypothetical protein